MPILIEDYVANARRALKVAELWLTLNGHELSDYLPSIDEAMKRRDKREPGRKEKELAEDKLAGILGKLFRMQKLKIVERLAWKYPDRKAIDDWADDLDPDEFDEIMSELIIQLRKSALGGVDIAALALPMLDPDPTTVRASKWAMSYAYNLIRGVNKTTIEAIRTALDSFITNPGMTIGDVVSMIPLSPDRALRIAVTETTRAYAEGNRIAGLEMADQFPDVRIEKQWFTNNDDLVCEICAPLNEMIVAFDEDFTTGEGEGIDQPPAHVNCRCWTDVSTKVS